MTAQEDVSELQPLVSEEDWQLPHCSDVQRAASEAVQEGFLAHVHGGGLYSLEVVLEALEHRVADLFEVLVVTFVEHLGDGVGYH